MKRGKPMKRSRIARGSSRVGDAARARRRAGGKRAVGRDSLPVAEYAAVKADIFARCGGRCEYAPCSQRRPLDPHHVAKSSHGAPDHVDAIVALCRETHDLAEPSTPFAKGRLMVEALGGECFRFWREWRQDKFSPVEKIEGPYLYTRPRVA